MNRVLLIEDSDVVVGQVHDWIQANSPGCILEVVGDRDAAINCLLETDNEYDLIICDLSIPTREGSLDARPEYGLQVYEVAHLQHPGTPCLFFTGHADDIDTYDHLGAGGLDDMFGSGALVPMVRLIRKLYAERAGDHIADMSSEIRSLDEIAVDVGDLNLSQYEVRVVQIFARRHKGNRAKLRALGGLSGTKTFGVEVFDQDGFGRASAFGKIASRAAVEDEERRFQQFVSVHLDPSCIPVLAGHVLSGAGKRAGLFYSFAERFNRSAFDVIETDETQSLQVLEALRSATVPWHNTGMFREVSVADLRRASMPDESMELYKQTLKDIDWQLAEQRVFTAPYGPQHCDLHGKNVLVDSSGRVMLIDFGEVERRSLGLDPIVLELSLLFHPDTPAPLPSVEACEKWADVDQFAHQTAFPAFVTGCRAWALDAGGPDLVLGLAYAHTVRQLRYQDTDKERALAIIRATVARLIEPR